jgi:hypothetical protein
MAAKKIYTIDIIRREFDRFFAINGRWPTTQDMDATPYLPTSKTLQRNFGSVEKIRKQLGLSILNYTKGEVRSQTAHKANMLSVLGEQEMFARLVRRYGRPYVHQESPMNCGNHFFRCDFEVFEEGKSLYCMDVFYPGTIRNLAGCVNIKSKKYAQSPERTIYLLCMNSELSQAKIDASMAKKKIPLPANIHVIAMSGLKTLLKKSQPAV